MRERIKIKVSEKRKDAWESILEILINQEEIGYYFSRDGSLYIYLDEESGRSLKLTKGGTWKID